MDDHSSPADEAFFAAIGRFTLAWAHLEFALDAAISIIHQRLSGHTIERDVPIHIGRKVKYLKLCLRKLEPLSPFRDLTLPILQEIAAAVEFRKNLVHGAINSHPSGATEINLIRLLHSSDGHHTSKKITVTISMVRDATNQAMQLANQAFDFTSALMKAFLK